MLRCDSCEIDFNPHYLADLGEDGCPDCGNSLYPPGCEGCGESYEHCCCPPAHTTLRAPPAAVARWAAIARAEGR